MSSFLKKEKSILEVFAEIFIFTIIILFPLMVDSTGFFKILECKWHSYLIITTTYISINIIAILYFLLFRKTNIFKEIKLNIIHWSLIIFLGINILSTFLSPFFERYNLFIGVGRGEGLIMISLYTISFLLVSLFGKFKKRHILYFSISSLLVSFIGFLQLIGFNPFNMYQNTIGIHNVSFISTIGNIDFASALYCLFIPISFGSFIFLDEPRKHKIIHILSVFFGFIMIAIMEVSSGRLALFAILILVLPFILTKNDRLSKFLIMIATVLSAYCINVIINAEYHYNLQSLDLYFQFNYVVVLYLIVIGILIYLSHLLKNTKYDISKNKKVYKSYYILLLACGLIGIVAIYLINFKSGFLYEIHELLHGNFDDDFGTYRVFLWKRTLKLIPEYPIIGTGPDSFAIRFMAKYTNDIAAIGPLTINDTAANVYLTMLMNIGILGLVSYLSFLTILIKKAIKNNNKYSFILLITTLCFLIQDFFNLTVVIITPLFWILLAILSNSSNQKNEVN